MGETEPLTLPRRGGGIGADFSCFALQQQNRKGNNYAKASPGEKLSATPTDEECGREANEMPQRWCLPAVIDTEKPTLPKVCQI